MCVFVQLTLESWLKMGALLRHRVVGFVLLLTISHWLPAVLAQTNTINIPAGQSSLEITAGQPQTVTWTNPSSGTVTIKLQESGPNIGPDTGIVLASGITASDGTATFTVDPNQVGQALYTLEMIDDTNPSNINFSPNFAISGAVGTTTAATNSAASSILTTSVSVPATSANGFSSEQSKSTVPSSGTSSVTTGPSLTVTSANSQTSGTTDAATSGTGNSAGSENGASSGLSTAAKTGIGVSAGLGAFICLLLAYWLGTRRSKKVLDDQGPNKADKAELGTDKDARYATGENNTGHELNNEIKGGPPTTSRGQFLDYPSLRSGRAELEANHKQRVELDAEETQKIELSSQRNTL